MTQFTTISKEVQRHYSLEELHTMWNSSGLGNPAKKTTVKRWLNNGPVTKNPRFEPWIMNTVSQHSKLSQFSVLSIADKVQLMLKYITPNEFGDIVGYKDGTRMLNGYDTYDEHFTPITIQGIKAIYLMIFSGMSIDVLKNVRLNLV